jgi:hypothetical protein
MKKFIYILLAALVLFSCKKDNDTSSEASIESFGILSSELDALQYGVVVLNKQYSEVHILDASFLASSVYPISFTPIIEVSEGASILPASQTEVTFNCKEDAIKYVITSEDGTTQEWNVTLRDNQIPNTDFSNWYEQIGMNGKSFWEPGKSLEATVWGTANMGTSTYSVYGTTKLVEDSNTRVKISTGETEVVPITSGTLFLGKFDIQGAIQNPTDPEKATDFGLPFILKPSAIRFKYSYIAGDTLRKFTLKDTDNLFGGFDEVSIAGTDECMIYALLEVRDGDYVKEIARVEYSGGTTGSDLTELTLDLVYTSTETPTHISIVFASSKDGDKYTGAVGSTLIIDDLELIYD